MPHPSQPKQILISKRGNMFYLDRARIMVDDGCVRILGNHADGIERYLNLPDKNTSLLLLGHGTSITNEAVRLLASSCVMVGFCGTSGSPPYAITDITFMPYQDEYRPTKYMQDWAKLWFDEKRKLACAKFLLSERIEKTMSVWDKNDFLAQKQIIISDNNANKFLQELDKITELQNILLLEARWTKYLYKLMADKIVGGKFTRERKIISNDQTKQNRINKYMNHGNYLAYGVAATVLHGLGISFAFPMLHGKTRRGGLVLDIADLIKDPYVMPLAFEFGSGRIKKDNIFRAKIMETYLDHKVMDYAFNVVKTCIERHK